MKPYSLIGVFMLCGLSGLSHADVLRDGGTEHMYCSYKGKIASRPCLVHVDYVPIHASHMLKTIQINWPDGDESFYTWNCFQNECTLTKSSERGGWANYTAQRYIGGYVIRRNGREWVRLHYGQN